MPSLSQLLAAHGPLLVLDAATPRMQAGLLRPDQPALWRTLEGEAGHALFAAADALFLDSGHTLAQVGAFVFCEGPGSMLGIRTVAMALRTWQVLRPRPAYSYQSLALAARFAWRQRPRALALLADARRDTWHLQAVAADGSLSPLQRLPAAALPSGELLTPEHFRAWSPLPRPAAACTYDLAQILTALADEDLFRPTDLPDALQYDAPDYKKWSAQVHSAATAPRR